MIRRQRTRVTVYRGTPGQAADGNRYLSGWAAVASEVPVNIQEPTAERVATVFGTDYPVQAVAYADPDALREEDRFLVTAGPFVGEAYQVASRIRHRQGSANDHDELALVATSETIP